MLHPWHGVTRGKNPPEIVTAIIEVPKGSQTKYELDKVSGLLRVDRILYSSVHYPVNYGYIPNTISGDGEELDAYLLGVHEPVDEFEGRVIAIIHRINDNDDKLVVMEEGRNYTDDQIRALTEFQEKYFESKIIR